MHNFYRDPNEDERWRDEIRRRDELLAAIRAQDDQDIATARAIARNYTMTLIQDCRTSNGVLKVSVLAPNDPLEVERARERL